MAEDTLMSGTGADFGAIHQAIPSVSIDLKTVTGEVRAQGLTLNDLDAKVEGLRQAVTAYHATVLGHGILSS